MVSFYALGIRYAGNVGVPEMIENPSGEYVKRADYEKLLEQHDHLISQRNEYTSERIASIASAVLRNEDASPEIKSIAASVLTQTRDKDKDEMHHEKPD